MNDAEFRESFYFQRYHVLDRHTDHREGVSGNYLVVLHSGTGVFHTEEETLTLVPGDFLFIPAGCRYESYWHDEKDCCFDTLVFTYFPEPIDAGLQKLVPSPEVKKMHERIAGTDTVNGETVGLLYQMLHLLRPQLHSPEPAERRTLAHEAIYFMQHNTRYSIRDVAEECAVSPSVFYDTFKKQTGKTPAEARQEIRVEKTVLLLQTTDLSVEAISDRVGFCSPAYLRKILRDKTGQTPKEIRRKARKV